MFCALPLYGTECFNHLTPRPGFYFPTELNFLKTDALYRTNEHFIVLFITGNGNTA